VGELFDKVNPWLTIVFESCDKGTGELGVVLADGELKRGHGLGEALATAGCVRSRGIRMHRTLKTGLKVGGVPRKFI
jgi:hypothetical protein